MEIKRQVDGSRRLLGSVEHDSHVGAAGMAAMAGWAGGDEYLAVGARDRAWRGMAWHGMPMSIAADGRRLPMIRVAQ